MGREEWRQEWRQARRWGTGPALQCLLDRGGLSPWQAAAGDCLRAGGWLGSQRTRAAFEEALERAVAHGRSPSAFGRRWAREAERKTARRNRAELRGSLYYEERLALGAPGPACRFCGDDVSGVHREGCPRDRVGE